MPDIISAQLVMELNICCPGCGHCFDLFKSRENEEGKLYRMVLDDDRWEIPADDRLETETCCPSCSLEFLAKGVQW